MSLPPLTPLHSDSSLLDLKLNKFRKASTDKLVDSPHPSQAGCLKTRPNGTILDGHHRLKVLRERGFDVDRLPRDVIPRHDNWYILMNKTLYPIDGPWSGRLSIAARPRGDEWLQTDMIDLAQKGIDVMVSMLMPLEAAELRLEEEGIISADQGIDFVTLPIPDRDVPDSLWELRPSLERLYDALTDGQHVAVHCRHGIGRSALIAASLLTLAGINTDDAFTRIETARGRPVPDTPEQRAWVEKFVALEKMPAW